MPQALSRLSAAFLMGLALALPVSGAPAQVRAELPVSVTEAASIGASERTQIDQYIAQITAAVNGTDAEAITRARRDLVTPLTGRAPSVSFRQAYAQASSALMGAMLASEDPAARIAGLRLAGHLGTGEATTILRNALKDSDAGVRLFAAVQARRVFEVTATAGAAVTEPQLGQLIDALGESVNAESPQPHVQAVIRALGAGSTVRSRDLSATRSRSLAALSRVASARVRAMGPQNFVTDENTILEAATLATRSLSEAGVAMTDEAAKAAAEFGGDMLSMTLRRQTQNLMGTEIDADLRLLNAGESLIYFARRRQVENARGNAAGVPQTALANLLSTRDRGFRNELVRLIGPGSDFLRQFGLPDARFVN